ncbi:MAG: hypothetical protein KIT69_02040 [Propionibacteriaceae bacterium]|nr:hypothetical protein [Propionibacteriaceae bacterium]
MAARLRSGDHGGAQYLDISLAWDTVHSSHALFSDLIDGDRRSNFGGVKWMARSCAGGVTGK